MRILEYARTLVGAIVLLTLATPAAAQRVKVDLAGGYQFIRFFEEEGSNMPFGLGASIAVGRARLKVVGEFGGNYASAAVTYVHTFQGGVEFSGKHARVVPFARVLAGLADISDPSQNGINAFVFTPEGGVKILANDRVGVQASLGFPIMRAQGETLKTMRFFVGVVIRK